MSSETTRTFSASRSRFILASLGTMAFMAVVFTVLGLSLKWVLITLLLMALVIFLRENVVTKIVITSELLEIYYQNFFIESWFVTVKRPNVLVAYKSKAGPKGMPTMALEIKCLESEEVLAEIQADLTGWKEADLIEISKLLN